MSDGISGVKQGGFFEQMGGVVLDLALTNHMMNAMNVPVKAGDNKGAQERFQKVRDLLNMLSPEKAGELLDHLLSKGVHDPLAQKILHTFSNVSVEKLKSDLRTLSGRANLSKAKDKGEEILRSPQEKKARKSESALKEQMNATRLTDIFVASQRAEKMFKASDVLNKDPDAILSALGDLTVSQMKELVKVFPEKYGISLEVFLEKELQGLKLIRAQEMISKIFLPKNMDIPVIE